MSQPLDSYAAHWDAKTLSLFFVAYNLPTQCLFRYDYKSKMLYGASIDAGYILPGFIIPIECSHNQYAVGIQRTIMIIEWDGFSPVARFIRNATSVEQNPIYNTNGFDRGIVDDKGT